MDNKAPSSVEMATDTASQAKTEIDFVAQASQARMALEQLSAVLGMKNPSESLIIAAMDQIMKTIVCLNFIFPCPKANKLISAPVQRLSQIP